MKIIIGTANFDKKYGYRGYSIQNNFKIKKILNFSKKNKIFFLDTAFSYINNEKILNLISHSKLKIISKFSLKDLNLKKFDNNIFYKLFDLYLKKLKKKQIHTLLLHNVNDLKKKSNRDNLISCLKFLKKKKLVQKIGVSVYEPFQMKTILKYWKPDIVQIPINPLNNSFLKDKFMNRLKKKKIEIHARSIFLQGAILKNVNKLPNRIKRKKKLFIKWNNWCKKNKISKLKAAIQFIKANKKIDKMVVGVDKVENLKQIVEIVNKKDGKEYNFFKINTNASVDPRKW